MEKSAARCAIKRVYDEPAADDGYRILVDRLWPRGVSKERARLDLWLKDVAPSPPLLFGARDPETSHARVLLAFIQRSGGK